MSAGRGGSLISPQTRQRVRTLSVPLALALGRLGLTPNALTVIGFAGAALAGAAAAAGWWLLAGLLLAAFGIFDLFDGALARATGRATSFGAFLDSTLDRTGENLVLSGVALGASGAGLGSVVAGALFALAFGSMVTYARARAEAAGVHGEVGVAPRPERLALIAGGLVLSGWPGGALGAGAAWLFGALSLVAALSAITLVQRIVHVRRQLDQ